MTGTTAIATEGEERPSGSPLGASAPNFFVLGGAKCGTTSLYHLLRQVEGLYLPERKEPRFFAYDSAYERGIAWYVDQYFSGAARFAARGEATPQYLHGGRFVAERIRSCLGEDLRFIVLLRDPVKRAWSHFLHARRLGIEKLAFRDALAAEKRRLAENSERWCGYFSDGLYAAALKDWFSVFPRERFLLMLTEELERNPRRVVERVCAFIGIEPPAELEIDVDANSAAAPKSALLATVLNSPNGVTNLLKRLVPYALRQNARDVVNAWNRAYGPKPAPMTAGLERRLRTEYREDVEALERLTGFDLAAWRAAEPLRRARS